MTDETRDYCSCGVSIRKGTIFCCMCEPIKKEEEIKDWIETCLDGDAHGKWVRAPLFSVIEDVAELMAPRIVLKIDQALTAHTERIVGEIEKTQNKYCRKDKRTKEEIYDGGGICRTCGKRKDCLDVDVIINLIQPGK
jgi:hypothetical protein